MLSPKRKGRITGSIVGAILGVSPYMSKADAMRYMVREWHGAECEFKGNPATEWGKANEARAIDQLELLHLFAPVVDPDTIVEHGFFIHPEYDWLGATPDGLVGDDAVVEVKCPWGIRNDNPPQFKSVDEQPHYFAQKQIEMACTGRSLCHFYQWAPYGDDYDVIEYSQAEFEAMLPTLKEFYDEYLLEREMPNAQRYLEPKHKKQNDTTITSLAINYNEVSARIKELDQIKKDLLAEIVERCGERQSEILGKKLTQVERKGNVAYAKIPELKDVDLEQYRGKSSTYWVLK